MLSLCRQEKEGEDLIHLHPHKHHNHLLKLHHHHPLVSAPLVIISNQIVWLVHIVNIYYITSWKLCEYVRPFFLFFFCFCFFVFFFFKLSSSSFQTFSFFVKFSVIDIACGIFANLPSFKNRLILEQN